MKAFATLSKLAVFLLTCSERSLCLLIQWILKALQTHVISNFPATNSALLGFLHGQFFGCLCLKLLHFNIILNGEVCYCGEPDGKQYKLQ